MARARNIKPGFFSNDDLVELPFETRLLFIGLWTIADRSGRILDRPKKIKMDIFPGDSVDVDSCLTQLAAGGFIHRYEAMGVKAIQVTKWEKHQNPHVKEVASTIPFCGQTHDSTMQAPDKHHANPVQVPEIPERAGLIPDSLNLIPDTGYLIPEEAPAAAPKKTSASGSRLPEDWKPNAEDIAYCKTERPDLLPSKVAQNFFEYWTNLPDSRAARKLDWSKTWRVWVRKEDAKNAGRGPPGGGYLTATEKAREWADQLTGRTQNVPDRTITDINAAPGPTPVLDWRNLA